MIQEIKESELEIMELMHDPIACSENMFIEKLEDLEDVRKYRDDSWFHARVYQYPMFSYEYLIAKDPQLSDSQHFDLLKGSGDNYDLSGRKIGKSLIKIMDLLLDTMHHYTSWSTVFSSCSDAHVDAIAQVYVQSMKIHPFFRAFKLTRCKQRPYRVVTKTGHRFETVNMNLSGRHPGSQWEHHHAHKQVIDEWQYETEEVEHKRSQATSEKGTIERFSGICTFKKHMPAGKVFLSDEKSPKVVNLPEYVSPYWTDARKKESVEHYSGEDTIGYLTNVKAELCEDAKGLYQIALIRKSYNKVKYIKRFEIKKESLDELEHVLIVDRPLNVQRTWIAGDFGEKKGEIIVAFEVDGKFKYEYNISLYNCVPDDWAKVYEYLISELRAEIVAIDATEVGGKEVIRRLVKKFGDKAKEENLVAVKFNEKVPVDFKRDDNGQLIRKKDGKPELVEERIPDWSVRQLKKLLYDGNIFEIPKDSKFDKQFNGMESATIGGQTKYASNTEDHLHQAFQVLAIAIWLKYFKSQNPVDTQKKSMGATGLL